MAQKKPTKKANAKAKTTTKTKTPEPTTESRTMYWVIGLLLFLGLVYVVFGLSMNDAAMPAAEDDTQSNEEAQSDESDAEDTESTDDTAQSQSPETTVEETDDAYQYVAGAGESFTGLARRSVAAVDGELTTAERVAAETKLAQDANAGYLDVSESVQLDKATVRSAVEWAKNLSADQKAAWQPYADLVTW